MMSLVEEGITSMIQVSKRDADNTEEYRAENIAI
jgi:hypothetical protein